jgi:hypothetical protein
MQDRKRALKRAPLLSNMLETLQQTAGQDSAGQHSALQAYFSNLLYGIIMGEKHSKRQQSTIKHALGRGRVS